MTRHRVREHFLSNGFKLITKEDHRAPIAIFQIFYKVGSSYEHNGITGVSHALEHMMFRGTNNYSANEFLQTISEQGGQQNAHTTHDYTAYYEIINIDKLFYSFRFEADRMRNLLLRPQDFSKEIQIVKEERRMTVENDPKRRVLERFFAVAFMSSSYRHPIIGWMDDLENMSVHDLKKWYNTWYAPNNAVGVVIGNIVPEKVHQLAEKYFGSLKSSVIPKIKTQKELAPLGMRSLTVKVPAKLPWLIIGFNVPVLNTAKTKWEPYALLILCEILASGTSCRLQKNLVRQKRLAMEVDYHYSPFMRTDTVLTLSAVPVSEHHMEELKNNLFMEIQQLQDDLVSSKELNRIKINIIADKTYQADSLAYQAHEIGSFEAVGLSWTEIDKAYKAIEAIKPEQIKQVACKYLIPDHLTIAKLEPLPM